MSSKSAKETPPLPPASRNDKPVAPPSVKIDFQEQQKKIRSQSMIVSKTKFQPNSIGQTPNDPVVVFDPKRAFSEASKTASPSFPRSELQLPETSTLLHPGKVRQIIVEGSYGDDVGIQIKTKRSHTIAGDAKTIKLPSGYRETLLKRRQESFPQAHLQGPSLSDLITQPNLPNPTPSPPSFPKNNVGKAENESESSSSSSCSSSVAPEATSGSASYSGETGKEGEVDEELPYALQYNEGLIDFVDHPPIDGEGEGKGDGEGEGEGPDGEGEEGSGEK